MLDKVVEKLRLQDPLVELTPDDWRNLSKLYAQEPDSSKANTFIHAVAAHSGISAPHIQHALTALKTAKRTANLFSELQKAQRKSTLKIIDFQQRDIVKAIDWPRLSINREEWNALITKHNQLHRQQITSVFFLSCLSTIQKVSYEDLLDKLSKHQPSRTVKRPHVPNNALSVKRFRPYYDEGPNSLIYEHNDKHPDLDEQLLTTGVRVVDFLKATDNENGIMKTPGGSKVKVLCEIGQTHRFFKKITPKKMPPEGNTPALNKEQIQKSLPKLSFKRADPVEYTATLAPILQRSGMARRQKSRAIMGASAEEVFQAHGVEIKPNEKHKHHWAHLIAHFLTSEDRIVNLSHQAEKELINLVPTTAEANYNILESIELFIKNKLQSRATTQIQIQVYPFYSDENLIPETLSYHLNWSESKNGILHRCNETFHINPLSHYRITRKMHESIEIVRQRRDSESSDELGIPALQI